MIIYAICGKFFTETEREIPSGDYTYCPEVIQEHNKWYSIHRSQIKYMAEYIIDCDGSVFKLTKNHFESKEIIFFSFDDLFNYINSCTHNHFEYLDKKVYCKQLKEVISFFHKSIKNKNETLIK